MFEINKLNFNKVYEGVYVMNSFYKDPHLILDLFNKYGSKNIYNIIEITLKLDVNIIFSRYTCIFLKFLNIPSNHHFLL